MRRLQILLTGFAASVSLHVFILTPLFALNSQVVKKQLIIRQNSTSSYAYSSGHDQSEHELKTFANEAQKQQFMEEECGRTVECEENQIYKADEGYVSQSIIESTVAADPLAINQWSIVPSKKDFSSFGSVDIDVLRAWQITRGKGRHRIYILDSGGEFRAEPDLMDQYDVGYNAKVPSASAQDDNSHGTHIAGIIGASGNNNYGIVGVMPGDSPSALQKFIVPIKFLDANNQGDTDGVLRALDIVSEDWNRTQPESCIINMSFSGDKISQAFQDKLNDLTRRKNCLVVTSAGNAGSNNDEKPTYPCNYSDRIPGVICVAAVDRNGQRAVFSNYGKKTVHLGAPGTDIYSIVPGKMIGSAFQSDYGPKSGTSQAGPQVAGVAGLIWSVNSKLSNVDVAQTLVSSVDRLPGLSNATSSGGQVNAYRAVLIASGQDPSQADRFPQEGGGCSLSTEGASSNFYGLFLLIGLILILSTILRSGLVRSKVE